MRPNEDDTRLKGGETSTTQFKQNLRSKSLRYSNELKHSQSMMAKISRTTETRSIHSLARVCLAVIYLSTITSQITIQNVSWSVL